MLKPSLNSYYFTICRDFAKLDDSNYSPFKAFTVSTQDSTYSALAIACMVLESTFERQLRSINCVAMKTTPIIRIKQKSTKASCQTTIKEINILVINVLKMNKKIAIFSLIAYSNLLQSDVNWVKILLWSWVSNHPISCLKTASRY